MIPPNVIIIGGGPSGLTALKTLTENGFEPFLLEAEQEIGGTFKYRAYENAELVSSKQLTCFSDFRMPLNHADHVSLPRYVEYLNDYVSHWNLKDRIQTGARVKKASRMPGGGHKVVWEQRGVQHELVVSYLCICSGLHVTPQIPMIPGIQHVKTKFHSAEYKSRDQLAGKRVLILGTGETGMDVSYEAIKGGAEEVVLCTRNGFLSFPKVLNNFSVFGVTFDGNIPIDGLITNLFESTYIHPWVAKTHLRWHISDFVIKRVLWLLSGTQAGCSQWVGELPKERLGRAYAFLNKSTKAMPYINRPYKKRSKLMSLISSYHDLPEDASSDKVIHLAPFPERFADDGSVIFKRTERKESKAVEGKIVKPEVVVFATGYEQKFDDWLGPEYPRPWDCDARDIVKTGQEDVAFIGFVRPGVGAIPPIAEQQAMWWTLLLQRRMNLPITEPTYYLLSSPTSRIKYGVDHSTYMSTLAGDMGSLPSLFDLLMKFGPFICFIYCFSAAFTTNYRLVGPFASPLAPTIVKTEIWETITRRKLLGNIFMGVIPIAFYLWVNITVLLLEITWRLLGGGGGWAGLKVRLQTHSTTPPAFGKNLFMKKVRSR